jgi:DNA-binding HxlR family transcriptional regulator
MSKSYRMLCPIARALDRVKDRWTVLVLRDLHAGPTRFLELQRGMPGLASNLLSTRLERMQADGLIRHEEGSYRLSDLGRRTDRVLWELALLGMEFPPDPDLKPTGHLRLVAITMQSAMRKVVDPDLELNAEMILDGESFSIHIEKGKVRVRYGALWPRRWWRTAS